MDESFFLERVIVVFREYGFDAKILNASASLDGELILERDGVRRVFALEIKLPLTLSTARIGKVHGDVLYVTDRVSNKTADALRRAGVAFIDAAGNVFLATGSWYVDVRGRRSEISANAADRAVESVSNLYSSKRSQVIFTLLTWDKFLGAPVRALAKVAGVSVGLAQSTTNELHRRGLWPDRDDARATLIDGWAAAFPETLGRSLTIRSVRAEQFESFSGGVLASGEAAPSAHMRANSGVVYVDELSTELLFQNRWRTDGPYNLVIRRRFWSQPDANQHEAPALLVYADLRSSDDPRTRARASEYRQTL